MEMAEAVLEEVKRYVSCRNNTVEHINTTIPITDMLLAAERRPGTWLYQRWWWWDNLDPEEMRAAGREP